MATNTAPSINGFKLLWVDDFEGAAGLPSTDNWNIIESGPNWGNHEVQYYTTSTSNVTLTGSGQLNIAPQKDANNKWTSGRLECKKAFTCPEGGKMVIQANLRTGTAPISQQAGIWPAFWTLGDSIRGNPSVPWPRCGEMDIMENSSGQASTLASLHFGDANNNKISVGGGGGPPQEVSIQVDAFNTYSITYDRTPTNWQDQTLTWSLNGKPWFTVYGKQCQSLDLWTNCAYRPYFPILNVAVGNNFPGATNSGQPDSATTTGLGSGLQVSYVAAYQYDPHQELK